MQNSLMRRKIEPENALISDEHAPERDGANSPRPENGAIVGARGQFANDLGGAIP